MSDLERQYEINGVLWETPQSLDKWAHDAAECPERIWVDKSQYGLSVVPESAGLRGADDVEYIRADLLPRWRPIAELPDEWRDGRQVFIKNMRGHVWTCEYQSVNVQNWGWYTGVGWLNDDDIAGFLDFGGKSMPD